MSSSVVTPGNIIALGLVGGGAYFAYRAYQDFSAKKLGSGIASGTIAAGKTIYEEAVKPIGKGLFTGTEARKFWNNTGRTLDTKLIKPIDKFNKATNPGEQVKTLFHKDTWKKAFKKIF